MRVLSIILLAMFVACSDDQDKAPDRKFYFEIIARGNDSPSVKLADYINNQLPRKKYTITNHSGLAWPFYKELDLTEKISKDSLMPPHWYVHRMIPLRSANEIEQGEFLVRIFIAPRQDTLPNYNVEIFRKDSTGLSLSGQSGVHYIDSAEFASASLCEVYLKSILRYSFK